MKLSSYLRGLGIGMAATALILHFSGIGKAPAMTDEEIKARAVQLGMSENIRLSESGGATEDKDISVTPAPTLTPTDAATPTPIKETEPTGTEENTQLPADAEITTPTQAVTTTTSPTIAATGTPTTAPTKAPTNTPTKAPTKAPTATPTPAPTAAPTPTKEPTPTAVPLVTPTPASASSGQVSINTEEKEVVVSSGDDSYSVSKKMVSAGIITSAAEFDKYMCANGYDRHIATGIHKIPAGSSYRTICEILTKKR